MKNSFRQFLFLTFFTFVGNAWGQSPPPPPQHVPPPPPPPPPPPRQPPPPPQFHNRYVPNQRQFAPTFGAGVPLMGTVFVPNVSFYMSIQSGDEIDCPSFFTALDERSRTNQKSGVFLYSGEASMRWFASNIQIISQNKNRAVWQGTLRPEYTRCKAEAVMSGWANLGVKPSTGHLSLVINNGLATFMTDLSKYKTAVLQKASLSDTGRPKWQWLLRKP